MRRRRGVVAGRRPDIPANHQDTGQWAACRQGRGDNHGAGWGDTRLIRKKNFSWHRYCNAFCEYVALPRRRKEKRMNTLVTGIFEAEHQAAQAVRKLVKSCVPTDLVRTIRSTAGRTPRSNGTTSRPSGVVKV